MCEKHARGCRSRALVIVMLLFVLVGVAAFLASQVGRAKPGVEEAWCAANLRMLYDALVKYVSLHGDVPRGKDGKASIDPLKVQKIQEELGIDSSVLRCPADKNPTGSSYLLNPALSVRDLGRDSATIIACDRLPRHPGARNQDSTNVLIGDGAVVWMSLSLKEQEAWRRLFLSGDRRACTASMNDGSQVRSWINGRMQWYVGEEKGYVPNE